ncbi:MAG: ATP-dependent helicase [Candidatus Anammoxibacter sp.]
MNLLDNVTDAQKEAITHVNGPLLVIACAGSGKTRVITRRVAYLIEQGINPYNILALTFTNKAANEMKERVNEYCKYSGMWISTFHSMCVRILRVDIEKLGYSGIFTIYDKQDQLSTIKGVMKELSIDTTQWSPNNVGSTISMAKNNLISVDEYTGTMTGYYNKIVSQIYAKYETVLKNNNALDFDDLLFKVVILFKNFPDVLEKYQDKFKFILIDEYQDTNHTQYTIASLLSQKHMNICATGDPDQSIYSWRGADIRNILDFEKDFPDAKTVKLEQNYRSTKNILRAASEIINNNTMRKQKGLWTENPAGNKIKLFCANDENREAKAICEQIREFLQRDKINHADIAIFYRTNAQSRVIESALTDNSIPYVIVGSVEFFRRKEIKDILAYLKLCVNPDDNVATTRIINVPPRGIGKITLERINEWAHLNNMSILNALFYLTNYRRAKECKPQPEESENREIGESENIDNKNLPELTGSPIPRFPNSDFLKKKGKLAITEFVEIIAKLQSMPNYPVKDIVENAIKLTKYEEFLENTEGIKSTDKIENTEELISAANDYDINRPEGSLSGFLENVSLVADIDSLDEQLDVVTLMTLHSAKGLEFPIVFLTGMEEGLLPHSQAANTEFGLEEERRLCYVGITRAQKELILTYAKSRHRHGKRNPSIKSQFLNEIPEDILEVIDKSIYENRKDSHYAFDDYPEFDEIDEINIRPGDTVRHQTFGVGRVQTISGHGNMVKAAISFNIGGTKSLMLKYAKLEKI